MNNHEKPLNSLNLFAGGGGLSLGKERAVVIRYTLKEVFAETNKDSSK